MSGAPGHGNTPGGGTSGNTQSHNAANQYGPGNTNPISGPAAATTTTDSTTTTTNPTTPTATTTTTQPTTTQPTITTTTTTSTGTPVTALITLVAGTINGPGSVTDVLSLVAGANLSGTLDSVGLSLTPTSTWTVTGDSTVTELSGAVITGTEVTNITGNNHTVYYLKALPTNAYLAGRTYTLPNGGQLIGE